MTTPIRWGFLGAGGIARDALAPAVRAAEGSVLHAVGARDVQRAAALEPVAAYGSYDEVLADPDVDAVYIALNNDAHLPWTLRALAAGKPVLCEKPLFLTAPEVREAEAAAVAADRLLVEATWYRWHPRTQRAEELVAAGAVGTVRSVHATFLSSTPPGAENYRMDPAAGGGALYDLGHYSISAALWALGDDLAVEDVEVRLSDSGVDVDTVARLRGATGTALVEASFDRPAPEQRVVIEGTEGTLELVGDAFSTRDVPLGLRLTVGGEVTEEDFAPVDPYRLMVEAFSARIRGRDAFVVPLEDSYRIAAVIDAIRARS